jgi:hemerythrin-like domain-containing protein
MQALDVLSEEHRHILRVLDTTDQVVRRARVQQSTDAAYFQELSRFIARYADGAHHAKEEEVLFKALWDFGLPAQGGPLHSMLAEHSLGRDLCVELAAAANALSAGHGGALFEVLDTAARYDELMRSHIRKEDLVLFPMAEQLLPAEAFETMLSRYLEVTSVPAAEFARVATRLSGWAFADHEARV